MNRHGDECGCSQCDVDDCDCCGGASDLIDWFGESWCRRCYARRIEADHERERGRQAAEGESLTDQAVRLRRMKGEGRHE